MDPSDRNLPWALTIWNSIADVNETFKTKKQSVAVTRRSTGTAKFAFPSDGLEEHLGALSAPAPAAPIRRKLMDTARFPQC